MRFFRAILLIVIVTALGTLDTAEAGRLSGERNGAKAKYSYSMVSGIARAGKRSQRFEVRAGDCRYDNSWSRCGSDVERSEYYPKKRWKYGANQWIGFSVYLPSDFRTSSRVNTSMAIIDTDIPGSRAMMHLQLLGNSSYLRVWRQPEADLKYPLLQVSEMRGRWTDFVVHFDTSKGKQVLEVFVNGKLLKKIESWIRVPPKEYYFYYGIHRASVSEHGGPMPTQVLFIDEARMGRSHGKVIVNEKRPVD